MPVEESKTGVKELQPTPADLGTLFLGYREIIPPYGSRVKNAVLWTTKVTQTLPLMVEKCK